MYLLLQPPTKQRRKNPVDEWWTKHICLHVRNHFRNAELWSECFYRMTWTLSDQQLVTGIAILAASFKLFNEGTITAYHFSIARDLAFFSSNAHLLSLLALWNALDTERKTKWKITTNGANQTGSLEEVERRLPVPFVTWWRFFCMITFMMLLMAATWTSAYALWDDWADCPARCIPTGRHELHGVPFKWAIATTYFLVSQYLSYTLQLGEKIMGRAENLRTRVCDIDKSAQAYLKTSPMLRKVYKILRIVGLSWRFYNFSEFFELIEMMAWFSVNCHWVSQNRQAASSVFGYSSQGRKERAKEDEWGFGQVVPVLLLMLPAMTFMSAYHGMDAYSPNDPC